MFWDKVRRSLYNVVCFRFDTNLPDGAPLPDVGRDDVIGLTEVWEAVEAVELDIATVDVTDPCVDVTGPNVEVTDSIVDVIGCEIPYKI